MYTHIRIALSLSLSLSRRTISWGPTGLGTNLLCQAIIRYVRL